MDPLGTVKCGHREVSGTPGHWVITFQGSETNFGCSLILRMPDNAKRYRIGVSYHLYLEPVIEIERRKEPREQLQG